MALRVEEEENFRGGMPRRAMREKRARSRGLAACVQAAGAAEESESAGARDHDAANMGCIAAAFNYSAALECCWRISLTISAAATGMLVPGP